MALSIVVPAGTARAQDQDQEARSITLVGCVMREWQYRDMYGPGLSGPRGPGIGGRNEYMLVDAREIAAGTPDVADAGACPPAPGTFPTAYELTGSREGELDAFLGRRVELSGIRKEANARAVGSSGILRPTGGFDPLGHELHLFEVEVAEFREPAPARAEAPPVTPAPPPVRAEAPAPPPPTTIPEPEIAAAAPEPEPEAPPQQVAELPRTATPLPLAGLMGLLSLAAAAGIRRYRRRP
jgi:cell division septation protein DedD